MVIKLSRQAWIFLSNFDRSLTYPFLLRLPLSNIILPIWIPTLYLWLVDTFALRRGTWVIVPGTKLGLNLWEGLEIEFVQPETFFG